MYCCSHYNPNLRFIKQAVLWITIDNPHSTAFISIFRIFSVLLVDCCDFFHICAFLISSHIMKFVAFSSIVFQIRFFLRRQIVEYIINHVIIGFFQFFYLRKRLILSLTVLDFCHHRSFYFLHFFHEFVIVSSDSVPCPSLFIQEDIRNFLHRLF